MADGAFSFQILGPGEVDAAHRAHTASFAPGAPDFLSRGSFRTLALAPGTLLIGAGSHGALAGYALVRRAADEAELISIGVVPALRGRGLGGALGREALTILKARDARRVFLEVGVNNAPAIALYRALGFRRKGARKGYYRRKNGEPEDALIMNLALVN